MNLRRAAIRVFRSPRHCLAGAAVLAAALLRLAPAYLAAQTPQPSPAQAPSAATLDRCLASGAARTARGGRTGDIRFIGTAAGRPIPHPEPAAAAASPETAARAYLAVCGSLVGLADQASELAMTASLQAEGARRIVRFRQHQDGIPIVGAELLVNLDATGNIVALSGETRRSSPLNIIPAIDAGGAAQTALDVVANVYAVDPARLMVSPPELWIYDPALIGPERGPARLVWRMNVTPTVLEPIRELVMVDAERGSVALHFNQVETARNRLTYSANNTNTLPGALVCNEANPTCAGADADAVAAHVYAGDTYNFYLANHGRDSLNNAGMTLVSTVHYGPADYQNAFWNGQQMAYGNGFSQGDDIVGHELTHGVTSFTSHLFYYYQSGAINESLSDVFGELIDLTNGTANDTPAVRWLLGEEIGAIRNMQNPPALGDPDRMTSPFYYPGPNDNGGVHTNSGINNKAAFLMVDGGAFNGQSISALGIVKVAKIYYEAQTHLLTSGADYADLFEALYQACNNLVGVATTAGDCQQVRNATLAVEMHLQPGAGFNPEAPLCSPGQLPVTTFFDNLEAGPGNFTLSAAVGTQRWIYADSFAHSGTRSLYADDLPAAVTDTSAAFANGVAVPANAFLHFAHAFEFQGPNFDGGVLEYSTNGGASWTDAGPLIDSNGYTGTIAAGSNPLTGRAAFAGASHGYISTRANLASLAGQTVRFRWRMGLDASTFFWGWWLDDVRIYTCSGLGITGVTPNSSPQGFANLSVAVTGQSTHFVQGQTNASFGSGVIVHGTSVTDSTHVSVHVSVPSGAAIGFRDVTLTTGAEIAVGPSMFAVTPGATLTRVNPNRAQPGQQNLSVEISATLAHFLQGQTIANFGAGVTVASTRVIDANHVVANVFVAPDASLGPRTVMLTTGNELLTLDNGFTVRRLPAQTQAFVYAVGRRLSPSQGGGPGSGTQTVTVVDTATNAVTALISAGIGCSCVGADGIAVAPDGASVYVTNEIENSLSVIDAVTNAVTATIPLGSGGPIAVAVSPDSTRVYVVMGAGTTTVKVIDTSTHAILSSIPLGVVQARGMAITPDGARLYVSTYGSNSVKVVDTNALTVLTTIPVGIQPLGVDISADGSFVYVSNMFAIAGQGVPGTVSIISTATNTIVGTVGVGLVPYSAKASRDGSRAYVANATSSGVSVINAITRTLAGTVAGSGSSSAIGFTPDSTRAYLATGSSIQVVNVAANAVMSAIPTPSGAHGFLLSMAMSPGATRGIALAGDLDFGTVPVGGRATRTLMITNAGNSPLAVNSLAFPAGFSASFAGASIAAAGSQQVTVTFAPARAGSYSGTITAAGNQTLGRSTVGVSGYGSTDATRDTDFDRDTATDITVYRPSGGGWFVLRSGTAFTGGLGYSWGVSTDTPMPGDYDGDGRTDIAVFRPSTGHWFILTSSSNYTVSATYQWGTTGDRPVGGDFDGDGRSDVAVYRPSSGAWYVLLSSTGYVGGVGYVWGAAGDVPVPGDYDGDGRTDIAVYRGSSGHWFVLRSSSNYATWATYQWGAAGDIPVLGDYDGDNRRDLAVYRPSTGSWYVLRSSSEFTAGAGYQWGVSTDVPVPGDYDGDGRTDLAVYRSSSGHWFILKSSSGYGAAATYQWGTAGDIPVVRQQ